MYYLGDILSFGDQETQYYSFTDKHEGIGKVKIETEEIFSLKTERS